MYLILGMKKNQTQNKQTKTTQKTPTTMNNQSQLCCGKKLCVNFFQMSIFTFGQMSFVSYLKTPPQTPSPPVIIGNLCGNSTWNVLLLSESRWCFLRLPLCLFLKQKHKLTTQPKLHVPGCLQLLPEDGCKHLFQMPHLWLFRDLEG